MRSATTGVTEYDRFGPWITEVEEPDDVPRLYRHHGIDVAAERLVLKVPRNISRRNANPDMDLYDHLLVLGWERLTILSRRTGRPLHQGATDSGKGYDVVAIQLADVIAIRNVVNLLDGRLTVSTSTGASITVPYNGAAAGMVDRLVSGLKEASRAGPATRVGLALLDVGGRVARPKVVPDPGPIETFLVSAFLEAHIANPHLAVWAAHGRRTLPPVSGGTQGLADRVRHAMSPMTLHGALFAADAGALEVFGRHSWLVRGRDAIYSTSQLVVPFGAPDRLDVARHPLYPDVTVATIGAGEWSADMPVPRDSAAEQLLSEAASKAR